MIDQVREEAVLAAVRRTGQVELAIHALASLDGTDRAQPRKLEELRAGWDTSAKFLSNVLAELVRAGLVGSSRGHRGGYWLRRPLEEIEVVEVLTAVGPRQVPPGSGRPTPHWDAVAGRLRHALEHTSVAALVAEVAAATPREPTG